MGKTAGPGFCSIRPRKPFDLRPRRCSIPMERALGPAPRAQSPFHRYGTVLWLQIKRFLGCMEQKSRPGILGGEVFGRTHFVADSWSYRPNKTAWTPVDCRSPPRCACKGRLHAVLAGRRGARGTRGHHWTRRLMRVRPVWGPPGIYTNWVPEGSLAKNFRAGFPGF